MASTATAGRSIWKLHALQPSSCASADLPPTTSARRSRSSSGRVERGHRVRREKASDALHAAPPQNAIESPWRGAVPTRGDRVSKGAVSTPVRRCSAGDGFGRHALDGRDSAAGPFGACCPNCGSRARNHARGDCGVASSAPGRRSTIARCSDLSAAGLPTTGFEAGVPTCRPSPPSVKSVKSVIFYLYPYASQPSSSLRQESGSWRARTRTRA